MIHYIITPTWNDGEDFATCVSSVARHTTHPVHWVIVENGSRPEERGIVDACIGDYDQNASLAPITFAYLSNAENIGIPRAQNQALDWIAEQDPDLYDVVFLDADTVVVEQGWLETMIRYACNHPDVGMVGGAKSRNSHPPVVYYHTNGRWYVHDNQWLHPSRFYEGESVDYACVYLRPVLLARGIRFDEGYHIYDGHDQDFSFRVRSWGYRLWQIDPGVLHFPSSAMKKAGYQWPGGGKPEWDALRAKNLERFSSIWAPFLAPGRATVEEEISHMRRMNQKLVREAGERKEVPK